MASMIDVQARQMTDYRAEMQWKDTKTGQAFFKFFYIEQANGQEYKKYLMWKGKRVKLWVVEKPSKNLYDDYKKMRMENTDQFIEDAQVKLKEKMNPTKKGDGRIKDYSTMPIVTENKDKVMALFAEGKKVETIVRETGLTRYWVQRIQALNAKNQKTE